MRLDIADGYTLDGVTTAKDYGGRPLPVVRFKYRPALPRAIYRSRQEQLQARSGEDELLAVVKFVHAHLVSWDITSSGKAVDISLPSIEKIPDPILSDMMRTIQNWQPEKWEEEAGN